MKKAFLRSKAAAATLHQWIACNAVISRAYLALWSAALRVMPRGTLRTHVCNALASVAWPIEAFRARTCELEGSRRVVKLVPHTGMLDFQALFARGFRYEPEVMRFLEGHLAKVDNVIEIGANVGIHTLNFSSHLAQRGRGMVYAFEPSARAFRALLDNLRVNDVANVVPINAAVFSRMGIENFYEPTVAAFGDLSLVRSSLVERHARWDARAVREYPVLAVDPDFLARLLEGRGRVLVKMDIEGAETMVLTALRPVLERYRPDIVMEVLHNHCDELNALEFLRDQYRFFHITDAGPQEHPRFIGDPAYVFRDYFLSPR